MEDYFEIVRQVLIPMFYKETQLGRSLGADNPEMKKQVFKKQVFDSCLELANKADNGTLRNEDIRNKIIEISKNAKCSVGQTQKLVNVYLKYYCILTKKPPEIIRELDCPLDSQIMEKYKTSGLWKYSLREMTDFSRYVAWQKRLEFIGNGIRLSPDIKTYDNKRIEKFFTESE
jgi:hypothetical protein